MNTTSITLPIVAAADETPPRLAWRLRDWYQALGISKSHAIDLCHEGVVPHSKIGRCTFILISPAAFLEKHRVS